MRIVRPEHNWKILCPASGWSGCLQMLSLRCGYRIGEVCRELGCSERYLYEIFRRDIGLPPKMWMRWERMVVARRMLAGGKMPYQVGESLGFTSLDAFRREFMSFHRVPPLRFQRVALGDSWGG